MPPNRSPSKIGGSDIPAILGISENGWQSKIQLYERVILGTWDDSDNEILALGRDMEDGIRKVYRRRMADELKDFEPGGIGGHVNYLWADASPDDFFSHRFYEDSRADFGAEYKCVMRPTNGEWGEEWSDTVPMKYLAQCAFYTWYFDAHHWDLAALLPYRGVVIYRYSRNKELEESIVAECERFWNEHITPKIPPPPDGSDSYSAFLSTRYTPKPEKAPITPEVNAIARAYFAAEKELAETEKRVATLKQSLIVASDGNGFDGDSWQMTCRRQQRKSTKWKEVSETLSKNVSAELYTESVSKFTTVSDSLVVTLKEKEGA